MLSLSNHTQEPDVDSWLSGRSLCDGSSDRSFMVEPLSYFSFQPVLREWCNKGDGMCYPVCAMVQVKDPLHLIEKSSPCSGSSRFALSLHYGNLPYVHCHITINKMY